MYDKNGADETRKPGFQFGLYDYTLAFLALLRFWGHVLVVMLLFISYIISTV